MLHVLCFLVFLTNLATPLFAQLPWINTIKGSQTDFLQGMDITEEGNVIVTGYSNSTDYDFSGLNIGNYDIFLNKYNQNGKLIWKFNYGGSKEDLARHVKVHKNCIYITGNTYSFDNIFNSRTQNGAYLIKLDSLGKLIWIYNFGNLKTETETFRVGRSIAFASNDDILITGGSFSKVGDSVNKGELDIFVARINQNGKLLWKNIIGGSSHEQGTDILSTSNNGFIVLGVSQSNDGDFLKKNNGKQDIVIIHIDSLGSVVWNSSLGGSEDEEAYSICAAFDDGYVITGTTSSNDFDFQDMNRGVDDLFTVKLDSKGRIVWKKTYGGSSYDGSYSIVRDSSLGFTMLGYTCSSHWDQPGIQDSCRMLIAKINQIGDVISYQLYSGLSGVVLKKYNHQYFTAGPMYNGSFLGDTKGAEDSFVMLLDSNGKFIVTANDVKNSFSNVTYKVAPNPTEESDFITVHFKESANIGYSVELVDFLGTIRCHIDCSESTHSVSLPVSNLSKGMYLVRFKANNSVYTEKLLIN